MVGGIACVDSSTRVYTSRGPVSIVELADSDRILSLDGKGLFYQQATAPFPKGKLDLYRVRHERGEFVAAANHLVFCADGVYRRVSELFSNDRQNFYDLLLTKPEPFPYEFFSDGDHSKKIFAGFLEHCLKCYHQYGRLPRDVLKVFQAFLPQFFDDVKYNHFFDNLDDWDCILKYNHHDQSQFPRSKRDFFQHLEGLVYDVVNFFCEENSQYHENFLFSEWKQFQKNFECHQPTQLSFDAEGLFFPFDTSKYNASKIISIEFERNDWAWDIYMPINNNWIDEHGIVHHNTGKSFTGAHFAIFHIINYPELTGFVAANTYDQLSQATLRELMYWLTELGFEYVIDKAPPRDWNAKKQFKDYHNILSVKNKKGVVTTIFTRVLSDGDALRGLEFSWYWLDETRDTPENTHDVVLSRLRESNYIKGLVTTTPNAEDWVWKRFVQNTNATFGNSHTRSIESVRFGIITAAFYNALRSAYSPQMAAQELDAEHVSITDGRAYYCASERNKRRDFEINPDEPLVIGCDFNFNPAPMIWMVGQVDWDKKTLHWFDELCEKEISSANMARRLGAKYGDYYLRLYGDASGERGTTSNAGETDFIQIGNELSDMGVSFSIDTDQMNPRQKDRVENTNRLLCNANNEISMTYNPDTCPHLARDFQKVVWKHGKLSGNGDEQLTHAGDGCGYACWKIFPPQANNVRIGNSIASPYAHLRRQA